MPKLYVTQNSRQNPNKSVVPSFLSFSFFVDAVDVVDLVDVPPPGGGTRTTKNFALRLLKYSKKKLVSAVRRRQTEASRHRRERQRQKGQIRSKF